VTEELKLAKNSVTYFMDGTKCPVAKRITTVHKQ